MYKVKISESNLVFKIKGRQVRSPFEIDIEEEDLRTVKSYIKSYGITKYSITEITEPVVVTPNEVIKVKRSPKAKKENLTKKETISSLQLISKDELMKKKNDSEISIEELSSKSESTLEKFMNLEDGK